MESVSLTDEGVKPCSRIKYYDVRGLHLACQLVCHVAAAELADRRAPMRKLVQPENLQFQSYNMRCDRQEPAGRQPAGWHAARL